MSCPGDWGGVVQPSKNTKKESPYFLCNWSWMSERVIFGREEWRLVSGVDDGGGGSCIMRCGLVIWG